MIESHGTRFVSVGPRRAVWDTHPSGELRPELFPLTLQLSVNLVNNAKRGTLTAEAEIVHRGCTTLVVEVTVLDDERRLFARLVATQLAPAAPPATASADRPGR